MSIDLMDLIMGEQYDRPYLAKIWGYKDFRAISNGIVTPKDENIILLFITKTKQSCLTQYEDYFEDGILHMEGQSKHKLDNRLINSNKNLDKVYLFYREKHHSPFVYCGRVYLIYYELKKDKPSKFKFATSIAYNTIVSNIKPNNFIYKDIIREENEFYHEGTMKQGTRTYYERNQRNREEAIKYHGAKCKICGFDFNLFYGEELAKDFIEIHHIKPLSGFEGVIDPQKDLIPVCSNCHSIIHRHRDKVLDIDLLKKIISSNIECNKGE